MRLLVCLLLFTFSGCTFIGKKIYGLHDPRIVSQEVVFAKATKFGLDTKNDFYVLDSSALAGIFQTGFPKVYFYTGKGDLISKGNCFETLSEDFQELQKKAPAEYEVQKAGALAEETRHFRTFSGENPVLDVAGYDYVILIYWAEWMGKVNSNKFVPLEKEALANSTRKVKVIKVNADFQESWNLTEEQIGMRIAKK